MKTPPASLLTFAALFLAAGLSLSHGEIPPDPGPTSGIEVVQGEEKITINYGDKLFTEYVFKGGPRSYFYPVIGPNGENLTRHYPMKEGVEGEAADHPHHKSIWFTHGDINGHDFWADGKDLVVTKDIAAEEKGGLVNILQNLTYQTKGGEPVCDETRTITITPMGDGEFYLDWEIMLKATYGDVTLGDTKEGSMAIRVAPTMRAAGKVAKGTLVNSEGDTGTATWGKRARWCDYNGPDASGKIAGIAIFDHPENYLYPTTWHARDYGLLAANPFGLSYFEKKPKGTGNKVIKKGDSLTLRYRLYIHKGDEKEAKVDTHSQRYGK